MRPLTANLKHLYQYRTLWIFFLLLVIAISSLFETVITMDASGFPFVLSLMFFGLYGKMLAMVMTGTSAKPFAFCLPDHAREIKKMLFSIWLLMTIVCLLILSILFVFNIHIDPSLFIGFMGLMSLSFWLGTSVFIRKLQFLFIFFLFLTFSLIFSKNTGTTILFVIADHPWIIAFTSGTLSYSIYHAIGSRTNHRRLCALPRAGLPAITKPNQNRIKQEWWYQYQNGKISFNIIAELFGIFFTEHIRSKSHSGRLPYLWGQVYLIITPIFSRWKLIWTPFLGVYVFVLLFPCVISQLQGQQGPESYLISMIMLILFSLIFGKICTFPRFKNFLLSGRRVHFYQGIVVLLTAIILALGFLGASVLLFSLLSTFFPKIILMGKSFTIVSIPSILLVVVPFVMMPLFGGLFILFRGINLMIALSITTVFAIIVSFPVITAMENAPFILSPLIVLFAVAVTWGFHLAAIYYTSMKRSLC